MNTIKTESVTLLVEYHDGKDLAYDFDSGPRITTLGGMLVDAFCKFAEDYDAITMAMSGVNTGDVVHG